MKTLKSFLPILTAVAAFAWTSACSAATYTVVTTADSGAGSLRQAIQLANDHAGADTIAFNIPKTGWLFNGSAWFIQPESNLPEIMDDSTMVDGTSQAANQGNTNVLGPEVIIHGYQGRFAKPVHYGFTILSSYNIIKGLSVCGFNQDAIYITGPTARHNRIVGNYIGLNFTGQDTLDSPNNIGIYMDNQARYNQVGGTTAQERNVISGNHYSGIYFYLSDSNRVIGNYIGTAFNGMSALGNRDSGIVIYASRGNIIGGLDEGEANLISGGNAGIAIYQSESTGNTILGNKIGTNATGTAGLPGQLWGVYINSAMKNKIGPANVIKYNLDSGVFVSHSPASGNTITQNSISDNSGAAIALSEGANNNVQPPIMHYTEQGINGTTQPYAVVELFSDPAEEGLIYEGTVTADASGAFSWLGPFHGPNVTATMTDTEGNTSIFSLPILITSADKNQINTAPARFALLQNYPNPLNPSTTIRFTLAERAQVILKVFDLQGCEVVDLVDATLAAGEHAVLFNASGLAAGVYYCRLWAGDYSQMRKLLVLK